MGKHSMLAVVASLGGLILLGQGGGVEASEIKVLSAVAMRAALDELAPEFERQTGQKVAITYATAGVLRDRIQGGEMVDLTILPRPAMDPLVMQGKIAPGTVTIFARSANSVAVRAGAPKPDISTVEAFKRAMLAAKSVAYADPARGGGSGIHFASVLARLGIVEEMKPKTKLTPGDESVQLVAKGEAEIAVVNTPVILREPGVELVGPLPAELQNTTDFVFFAGVGATAKEPEAAKALINYLVAPAAARVIKAKGLEPR
ncbi:MAG: molybdate ABC transporter substrate-binding protein [Candidatus Rokuibacteriota bacterium]|nr:MAG: molybdate ABC transporter substrate-binding protein [Candidatus Rokubacteria bacterium]PYM66556.1 MAG: molybdate ABC transporter substrate-binding protein [Candidatus Rokubacteria bacterium]PYN69378.1 MAG: molybdate ABC transporter substrate-binding protein [Candidatus Rokubacteria bacterium]